MIVQVAFDSIDERGIELIIRGVREMSPDWPNWRTPVDPAEWSWGKGEA